MIPACLIPASLVCGRPRRVRGVLTAAAALLALAPIDCAAQTPIGYIMNTFAGDQTLGAGESGDAGPANMAQLNGPVTVVWANSNLYIADHVNDVIRIVTPDGNINLFAGTVGMAGYAGDGNTALNAYFNLPYGVALDSAGNVYIADTTNNSIRKVDTKGNVSTVAGSPTGTASCCGDNGAATSGFLDSPNCVVVDAAGNMYIADTGNNRVRKVSTSGIITTLAGYASVASYGGDGGPGVLAELNHPDSVAVDSAGNVYVADTFNHIIRKIAPNGVITTVAGTPTVYGFSGDGGPATKALLNYPQGITLDSAGNIYVADTFNNRIRRIGANGIITTIGGSGIAGYGGDTLLATDAALRFPTGVSIDSSGNLYVADPQNEVVRIMTPIPGGPPVISAGGVITASTYGGFNSAAPGSWIEIYGSNLAANTRTWTTADFTNILAPTQLDGTSVTIGGQPAFVSYISPNQLDAQVPNVPTGPQSVVVTTPAGANAPYTLNILAADPGLLAPALFTSGGKPYLAALFSDGVTFVGPPGAFPGVPTQRAHSGDQLTLYGVGFGPVTDPAAAPGKIELTNNTVTAPLEISFGQAQATVTFSGLAPLAVGLYQFNLTVPSVAASDTVPVTFTLGGTAGAQTLYTAIGD